MSAGGFERSISCMPRLSSSPPIPLTRASPCVGNLLDGSESEANALVPFKGSMLAEDSDPMHALQLPDDTSSLIDAVA